MSFPPALTATQLDTCRTGHFHYDFYLLLWQQDIIFQAQVNQATFADAFAQITYDNVTIGAIADIKADFICYLSPTAGNIKTPEQVFRVRADGSGVVATATILNINETSASLTDDWYIMVVKDVRCEAKLPRTIQGATQAANSYPRDYAIIFRRLLPIIYGLDSVYAGALNSSGYRDFDFAAQVLITDPDAVEDTWLWDLDGLSFQSGTAADASITARAATPGQYLPRVTHTDSLGNSNYFTFRVFVPPADYSSVVNLALTKPSIQRDLTNGHTLRLSADAVQYTGLLTRIDQYPDETFCAVWFKSNQPVITSAIVFVGWITEENIETTFGSDRNLMHSTLFTVEGVVGRFGDIISRRLPMLEATTPAAFGEIETLTPWRALAYFLTEHTTLTNICAVTFSDTSATYRYPRFGSTDTSVADSIISLLATINGGIDSAAAGGLAFNRDAWRLPDSARNALTTIANYTTEDAATGSNGGLLVSIARSHVQTVGRVMAGGGYYTTANGDVQVLRAITPAVAQSRGNQLITYNRQILPANSTINAAATELGQRAADEQAARQPQTIMRVTHPPAYHFMVPQRNAWYTWTIERSENNKRVSYDTNTRWILRMMTLTYNAQAGYPDIVGEYQKETQGGSYQTLVTQPMDAEVQYFNPVLPLAPVYAAFPEDPTSSYADPSAITEEDEPPFDALDQQIVSKPQDPSVTASQSYVGGSDGMCWDATHLWKVESIPTNPIYTDYTPNGAGTITDGAFDPFGKRALCISNDGTDTKVWRTKAFGMLQWVATTLAAIIYKAVLPTHIIDRVYIVSWEGATGFSANYDFTTTNESFAVFDISSAVGNQFVGTYSVGTGWTETQAVWGDTAAGVGIFKTITRSLITRVIIRYSATEAALSDANSYAIRLLLWDGPVDITTSDYDSLIGTGNLWGTDQEIEIETGGVYATNIGIVGLCGYHGTPATDLSDGITEIYSADFRSGDMETRYSTNFTATFASAEEIGEISAGESGVAIKTASASTIIYAAINDSIETALNGGAYAPEDDGDTTGTYALCIAGFQGTNDPYLFGTAAALGGETLFIVNAETRTAITPNDGANDGVVVGPNALAMAARNDQRIFGLFDFGGTVKLAYSADQGVIWQFNTQVTANAHYIRAKLVNGQYNVYICDSSSLWWGMWDGSGDTTLTLHEKGSPSTDLRGIEIK